MHIDPEVYMDSDIDYKILEDAAKRTAKILKEYHLPVTFIKPDEKGIAHLGWKIDIQVIGSCSFGESEGVNNSLKKETDKYFYLAYNGDLSVYEIVKKEIIDYANPRLNENTTRTCFRMMNEDELMLFDTETTMVNRHDYYNSMMPNYHRIKVTRKGFGIIQKLNMLRYEAYRQSKTKMSVSSSSTEENEN